MRTQGDTPNADWYPNHHASIEAARAKLQKAQRAASTAENQLARLDALIVRIRIFCFERHDRVGWW